MAQTNGYGGYDIVAFPPAETFYASARNWHVFSARGPVGFAYCFAEGVRDGAAYRLGWDGMQWQLAVPITSSPDWQGTLQIDGAGSGQGYLRGGDYSSGTASGGWTIAWLGLAELDGLQKGSVAVLGPGRADFDFSLAGSTAAILKVEECVARQGATAVIAAPSFADPSERTLRTFAVVGDWVISEHLQGSQVRACEARDTVQPTLRFEIDRDNSYIDFKDNGQMGGIGARVPVMIGFGPGSAPTQHMVEIIEGSDGEIWGRLTEGRMDGPGLIDDAFQNASQVSFQGPNIILERGLYGSGAALDAYFRCSNGIQ
ncbi:hypothetical protein GEU84_001905 [Fertoebacter nigrum]|uniref:Uncharacterized protein n=1 Tax=Fertoeibacter niger TaxID=2656921 RepID=A0A8X8GZ31_9RHOB|nr:hypothetical protein [Fertoeibacter niger]NUB43124.1 hypothetical protein [Fertoeibacter niger]